MFRLRTIISTVNHRAAPLGCRSIYENDAEGVPSRIKRIDHGTSLLISGEWRFPCIASQSPSDVTWDPASFVWLTARLLHRAPWKATYSHCIFPLAFPWRKSARYANDCWRYYSRQGFTKNIFETGETWWQFHPSSTRDQPCIHFRCRETWWFCRLEKLFAVQWRLVSSTRDEWNEHVLQSREIIDSYPNQRRDI